MTIIRMAQRLVRFYRAVADGAAKAMFELAPNNIFSRMVAITRRKNQGT